jgi:hypothetical protein
MNNHETDDIGERTLADGFPKRLRLTPVASMLRIRNRGAVHEGPGTFGPYLYYKDDTPGVDECRLPMVLWATGHIVLPNPLPTGEMAEVLWAKRVSPVLVACVYQNYEDNNPAGFRHDLVSSGPPRKDP